MSLPFRPTSAPVTATATALLLAFSAQAAQDRISALINNTRTQLIPHSVLPQARPENDRGPAGANMPVSYATLFIQLSVAQQADLDSLLADQQNPRSPNFHRWLSPEQFADRFGLSPEDAAKITDWLRTEGLVVHDVARGRDWITFSGSAERMAAAFHTEIHRYEVNGEMHFANATPLSIPEALVGIVSGVDGLDDFRAHQSPVKPQFTSGATHSLAPGDVATIYDIAPLYQQGIDGTGQSVVVVGQSNILLTDLSGYQQEFSLPATTPQVIVYGPDPGFNAAQGEAESDIEALQAVARNATILYVYANDPNTAALYAIDQNLAPVISESFAFCELVMGSSSSAMRIAAQKGNAQGITWLAAAGDSGPAGCDPHGESSYPAAMNGLAVGFPASIPEVTAVGGTEFNEGSGTYWSATNSPTGGSALSYIPEMAWDDSYYTETLEAGGGGASVLFSKPTWQTGPGVPNDGARDVPDVALSASIVHDPYQLFFKGIENRVGGGTSASTPTFAGMVVLLNHYVSTRGLAPGLGNINPGLYQMAQTTTDVIHDITVGNNDVPCLVGTADCSTGTLGYNAGPGYDLATGLGSLDAYHFVTEWIAQGPVATATVISSANANATAIAPGSLASAFGADLATSTPGSSSIPLPVIDAGTSVSILDATGKTTAAPLVYVFATAGQFLCADRCCHGRS
jgi:subtilase family serine protease